LFRRHTITILSSVAAGLLVGCATTITSENLAFEPRYVRSVQHLSLHVTPILTGRRTAHRRLSPSVAIDAVLILNESKQLLAAGTRLRARGPELAWRECDHATHIRVPTTVSAARGSERPI
jgi:hypothetical protein